MTNFLGMNFKWTVLKPESVSNKFFVKSLFLGADDMVTNRYVMRESTDNLIWLSYFRYSIEHSIHENNNTRVQNTSNLV